MTEKQWLKCADPTKMLEFLRDKGSDRKLRLFACACCRHVLHRISDDRVRAALEVSEKFADGAATPKRLAKAYAIAWEVYEAAMSSGGPEEPFTQAVEMVCQEKLDVAEIAQEARLDEADYDDLTPQDRKFSRHERRAQADFLRDIFGSPFRPVTVNPARRTTNVTALAQSIYDERAFDRLPILADALEDAGCDNADILNHCRQPGEHVRGCWAVDLVLGKD
jgi:hypothetical protein